MLLRASRPVAARVAANLPNMAAKALQRTSSATLALLRVPAMPLRAFSAAAEDIDVDSVAYGFMASQALFTGLEAGVFEAIAGAGETGLPIEPLKAQCTVDAPRLQTLVTSLVAIKCLHRHPNGNYTLSPNTSKFLVKSSRQYYGDYLRYQMGRQFYHRMGALPDVMLTGEGPSYQEWFEDPETAETYTMAQHNGSVATAKYLVKKKIDLGQASTMLDVGGGSGAFSYVFAEATPGLRSTVLDLPEVCRTGEKIKGQQSADVQERVQFTELDATNPSWPVADEAFDIVLMSYISGSVPEEIIAKLYSNAFKALKPNGRLLVHDFMVDDSLDGPPLGALWALQHVTVNAEGLGLCPAEIKCRMAAGGFDDSKVETMEMIHGLTKLMIAYK